MALGDRNRVRASGGWFYSTRVTDGRACEFYVFRGTETIGPIRASVYRTTTMARRMGERTLLGYEHAALTAIRGKEQR